MERPEYEPGDVPEINLLTGISSPPKVIRVLDRRTSESANACVKAPNV
jgi:hypothetical protein